MLQGPRQTSAQAWSSAGSLLLVGGVSIQAFSGGGLRGSYASSGCEAWGGPCSQGRDPLLAASSCSEDGSEGQVVLLGLWATGQRSPVWELAMCPRGVGSPTETCQAGCLSCRAPCPNALPRWSMEPADCTSLRQVEACALHKARADEWLSRIQDQARRQRAGGVSGFRIQPVLCLFFFCLL